LFPDVTRGTVHRGFRSENLEAQSFADKWFDLVVTPGCHGARTKPRSCILRDCQNA